MRFIKSFFSILIIIALSAIGISAQNVAGVYETDFGKLTVQQNGSKVTGTYTHAEGRIEGTINGNTLSGWWYQNNGKGKLQFNFTSSGFSGKWSYNNDNPSSQWNGKLIERHGIASVTSSGTKTISAGYSGKYKTDFGELTFHQNGNTGTGSYTHAEGKVRGTFSGNTFTGTWHQNNGEGRLKFVFNNSGFTGLWSYNNATPTEKWNGKLIEKYGGTDSAVSTYVASGKLSGVFTSDFGDITFHQSGNKVTATYTHADGKIDATLNGNTLTGWWYQNNGKGRMIFNFNSNFSGFTGKWSYNNDAPSSQWNGTKK